MFPDTGEKKRGDFVRNVHPCNVGRMPDGIVMSAEPDTGSVYVATGRGSTVYGPARNWVVIDQKPEWASAVRSDG